MDCPLKISNFFRGFPKERRLEINLHISIDAGGSGGKKEGVGCENRAGGEGMVERRERKGKRRNSEIFPQKERKFGGFTNQKKRKKRELISATKFGFWGKDQA